MDATTRDVVRRRADNRCANVHVLAMNDARRLELRSELLARNQL